MLPGVFFLAWKQTGHTMSQLIWVGGPGIVHPMSINLYRSAALTAWLTRWQDFRDPGFPARHTAACGAAPAVEATIGPEGGFCLTELRLALGCCSSFYAGFSKTRFIFCFSDVFSLTASRYSNQYLVPRRNQGSHLYHVHLN